MTPTIVKRELRKIGERVRAVRLARNVPMQLVAERAMTTRQTIGRIEAGDPKVSFDTVLAALNALGLLETVSGMAKSENDPVAEMKSAELRNRRARLTCQLRPKRSLIQPHMIGSPPSDSASQ